jgi:hypothetical protein
MVEDSYSLISPEVQLTIELEIGRRQPQSVKPEVQLQMNSQRSKMILEGEKIE